MNTSPDDSEKSTDDRRGLLKLALIALAVGAMTGVAGAVFRIVLAHADRLRDATVAWAHGYSLGGFLVVVLAGAVAPAIAAWLVRRFSPYASGSGIPHVEAALAQEVPPAPIGL
ncbi:MAG: ClC family H(+)/Cl(-) exchange transporter, partial [Xanthobacteraceae bacterium]